jgi:N6-adenosine-specific RNA methylase IME4
MSTALAKYDEACRALAEAKAVDEVQAIRNKADALRHAARIAKNRDLELDAAEIRMRAERRLGEMLAEQKRTVGLNVGVRGQLRGRDASGSSARERPEDDRPTLEEAGIDRKLSMKAQKLAAVPLEQFESLVADWRSAVRAENAKVTVNLLKLGREEQQRQARRDLARELSEASAALAPGGRQFPCVYADPAWRRKAGEGDRSYENHYPTLSWHDIMAMPVKERLLPDAWVFLWLPRAHLLAPIDVEMDVDLVAGGSARAIVRLPLAWAIARAWGCDSYSTCFVWTKTDEDHPDEVGTGLVVRDQDEILCLFRRGNGLPKPEAAEKFGSNHRERSKPLGHSRKPEHYRKMIASMTGGLPVLELFARVDAEHPLPPGWEAWGNQAGEATQPSGGEALAAEHAASIDADVAKAAEDIERQALVDIDDGLAANVAEDLLASLRARKLVKGGRGAPALTKLGSARLVDLLDLHRHREMLAELPADIDTLVTMYGAALVQLDLAAANCDQLEVDAMCRRLELLQERANGNNRFGMSCDDSPAERLRAENASPPGVAPSWGQRGVFRLVVEDVPHIVTHDEHMQFAVYAEDPDQPFLSETGYRSFAGGDGIALGHTVLEQAEAYIREAMLEGGNGAHPKPRKGPTDKPERVYRMPTSGFEPIVAGGDFFAEPGAPEFEDQGTEIPAFLPASTITADGCTPPAGGESAKPIAPPARSRVDDDLEIPAFLRRVKVPA